MNGSFHYILRRNKRIQLGNYCLLYLKSWRVNQPKLILLFQLHNTGTYLIQTITALQFFSVEETLEWWFRKICVLLRYAFDSKFYFSHCTLVCRKFWLINFNCNRQCNTSVVFYPSCNDGHTYWSNQTHRKQRHFLSTLVCMANKSIERLYQLLSVASPYLSKLF